jgi:hypothetical protein
MYVYVYSATTFIWYMWEGEKIKGVPNGPDFLVCRCCNVPTNIASGADLVFQRYHSVTFSNTASISLCMYILLQVAICSHFWNLSNPPKTTQHWWMKALLQIPPNRYKWLARGSQALNLRNTLQLACQGLQTSCSSWWSSHPRIWTHQKPNQKRNPSIGNMGVS